LNHESTKSNEDFYINEHGYKVFTEKYLLKRGYCCLNGCKHCPYGFDKNTQKLKKKWLL